MPLDILSYFLLKNPTFNHMIFVQIPENENAIFRKPMFFCSLKLLIPFYFLHVFIVMNKLEEKAPESRFSMPRVQSMRPNTL